MWCEPELDLGVADITPLFTRRVDGGETKSGAKDSYMNLRAASYNNQASRFTAFHLPRPRTPQADGSVWAPSSASVPSLPADLLRLSSDLLPVIILEHLHSLARPEARLKPGDENRLLATGCEFGRRTTSFRSSSQLPAQAS